jgi:hypothetical protein
LRYSAGKSAKCEQEGRPEDIQTIGPAEMEEVQ